jgi:hypothetical protein
MSDKEARDKVFLGLASRRSVTDAVLREALAVAAPHLKPYNLSRSPTRAACPRAAPRVACLDSHARHPSSQGLTDTLTLLRRRVSQVRPPQLSPAHSRPARLARVTRWGRAEHAPPPLLVLSGHAASLTPY